MHLATLAWRRVRPRERKSIACWLNFFFFSVLLCREREKERERERERERGTFSISRQLLLKEEKAEKSTLLLPEKGGGNEGKGREGKRRTHYVKKGRDAIFDWYTILRAAIKRRKYLKKISDKCLFIVLYVINSLC
jgi:hypothetical protein